MTSDQLPRLENGRRIQGAERTELAALVAEHYQQGATMLVLADELNRSVEFVRDLLLEADVEIRSPSASRRAAARKAREQGVRQARAVVQVHECPAVESPRQTCQGAATRMGDHEFAEAMVRLPDQFADRLTAEDVAQIRQYAACGVWDEEVDLLIAVLRKNRAAITAAERENLTRLLTELGKPVSLLDCLDGSRMDPDAFLDMLCRLIVGLRHRMHLKAFLDVTSWISTGEWEAGVRELAAAIALHRLPLYEDEHADLKLAWTYLGLDPSPLSRIGTIPADESPWGES